VKLSTGSFKYLLGFVCALVLWSATVAWGQFPGGGGGGGFPSGGGGQGGYRPPSGGGGYRPPTGGGGYQQPGSRNGYQRQPTTQHGLPAQPRSPYSPANPNRQLTGPGGTDWNHEFAPGRAGLPRHSRPHDPTAGLPGPQFSNPFYSSRAPANPVNEGFGTSPRTRVYGGFQPQGQGWQQAHQLVRSGQPDQARQMIDQQLGRNRSLDNLMAAVNTMEGANVGRSAYQDYRTEALTMARQQMNGGAKQSLPWVAVAKFSLEDNDDKAFRQAADSLATRFPDDKFSHYFQGIAAVKDGDWKAAEQRLRRAKELGVPDDNINTWLKLAIDNQRWVWQYATITLWVIGGWVCGLALLYVLGRIMSLLTLRATKKPKFVERIHGQRLVRWFYRKLIGVAGLYYYLSLPVLVIASIALPLTVCYALLNVPVLSLWLIALVAIVSIGSILTALSGIVACFVSLDKKLPGRTIGPHEHPRLWQLVREVAERVGTRPVDTIILLPSTDAAVVERGTFLARFRDRGERVLILGVGLLEGFSERAFCSVLAHEYGHFHNRDTAGGGIALRVNQAMENFAEAIMARGKIRWWHLAVHFLRFYYVLFNRITFGASRLQEIMADRTAVLAYGPEALEEGLTHAIRHSVEFSYWTSRRLEAVLRKEQVAATAFVQTQERPEVAAFENIETAMSKLIHRPTNETDTHPSPSDRFTFARRLNVASTPSGSETVWSRFDDPHAMMVTLFGDLQDVLTEEVKLIKAMQIEKISYLKQIIRHEPSAEAFEVRAALYMEQGDFAEANADLDRALKLAPQSIDAHYGKAMVHYSAKEYRVAAQLITALLEKFPRSRKADVYFLLGECNRDAGNLEGAETAFAQALSDRESPGTRLALGKVRAGLGKHQAAIDEFSAVIERFPDSAEAYVDRATSYEFLGQHAAALKDLQKAVSLWVVYPRAHREYARLLLQHGGADSNAKTVALRHAQLACAGTVGLLESMPVLVDAHLAGGDSGGAYHAINQLLPRLSGDEHARWLHRRDQYRPQTSMAEDAQPNLVWS
jgi:TolA-binding protein/Zn-dependent protease with chaperone function